MLNGKSKANGRKIEKGLKQGFMCLMRANVALTAAVENTANLSAARTIAPNLSRTLRFLAQVEDLANSLMAMDRDCGNWRIDFECRHGSVARAVRFKKLGDPSANLFCFRNGCWRMGTGVDG